MSKFSINISGRVKNFKLPKNQPLIPLFEAIVNSIHAIEERKTTEDDFRGEITIRAIREDNPIIEGSGDANSINSFEIVDNGVGFNEANFSSFLESDSTYKASVGGKGVGRFSWLIAFEKAQIESVYSEEDHFVKRSFEFNLTQSEIDDRLSDCDSSTNRTTVRLLNCMNPYADNLPKKGMTIAMRIIHHCLVYFISETCPQISFIDGDEIFDLNDIFVNKIKAEENHVSIKTGSETFDLLHVKVEEQSFNGSKLYLCAHNRLVETKKLENYITNLDKEFYKKNGFWYIGVLSGTYLDDSVDMNRLSFDIPEGVALDNMFNTITIDQIMRAVSGEVEKFLSDYLQPIESKKIERIQEYVIKTAPQFRHLLKYMRDDISCIKPDLSDEKLDDELHRIKRKFDRQIADENAKLLNDLINNTISSDDYVERFQGQMEKINYSNNAALAEYVAHRKVVLDLMGAAIRRKDEGGFQRESYLHNLIYPMRKTSNDLPYSGHNLWLIDEKLAYCSYISSDIPFNNDPKNDRTDIMILDRPVAVSDEQNDGTEYGTIVLFELKRPMRDDYSDSENPINQLYRYVSTLRNGNVRDKDGRLIRVGPNTKFYLYAVCDITHTLESILENFNFTSTPDRLGYYNFNSRMNAYIEILSYDKIINDAKKRNKILFDKLGI